MACETKLERVYSSHAVQCYLPAFHTCLHENDCHWLLRPGHEKAGGELLDASLLQVHFRTPVITERVTVGGSEVIQSSRIWKCI